MATEQKLLIWHTESIQETRSLDIHGRIRAISGTADMIKELGSSGLKQALITENSTLEDGGIDKTWDLILEEDIPSEITCYSLLDSPSNKEAISHILGWVNAVQQVEIATRNVLVVGNQPYQMQAATDLGMRALGYTCDTAPDNSRRLIDAGAAAVRHRPGGVTSYIRFIFDIE